jgi:protein TonB
MPRDLFGSGSAFDGVGTRQRYALPLAVLTHALVIATLVVVPLVATGAWPMPGSVLVFAARLPDPPAPEPPSPAPAQPITTVELNPNAAPPEASDGLAPEPAFVPPPSFGPLVGAGVAATAPSTGTVALAGPPVAGPVAPAQPPRVGGAIGEPRKVHDVLPAYPAIARAARAEGTVILDAVIAKDGSVREVTVLRSVTLLDQAAIAAVKQWRYTPTTLNGVAIDVRMTVTVRFSLRR